MTAEKEIITYYKNSSSFNWSIFKHTYLIFLLLLSLTLMYRLTLNTPDKSMPLVYVFSFFLISPLINLLLGFFKRNIHLRKLVLTENQIEFLGIFRYNKNQTVK